ncbi:hypothetical protein FOMPIDRAFT_1111662, partial [Fomitopsis schrenkii]
ATLTVKDPVFWLRLAMQGDLGFAEAYMYGEVDCADLSALFHVLLDNRACLAEIDTLFAKLSRVVDRFFASHLVNNLANARRNISAHYDISNGMFMAFLSGDMTYSCAIFPELDADLRDQSLLGTGSDSTKMLHIVKRADIRPGHRVLEIGSGWGSMAICMAQAFPGVSVDTLTLSEEQAHLARQRIADIGLGPRPCQRCPRVRVHLMDYRSMPKEWEGVFDRVVSVEMIEAVGQEFLEKYWAQVDWALKKDTGVGVVQGITLPEALFPGGFLPTVSLLVSTMASGSKGRLVVESVDNIGPHYARTLREWRRRFEDRFEAEVVPALQSQYPEVLGQGVPGYEDQIEVFKRKWVYYFAYCEAGFASRIRKTPLS